MIAADAPNVADWMQGWASLGAAVTSLVAIVLTGRLLRHEVKARRDDVVEASRSQAKLVTIVPRVRGLKLDWEVTNFSSAPIYGVFVLIPSDLWAGDHESERLWRGEDYYLPMARLAPGEMKSQMATIPGRAARLIAAAKGGPASNARAWTISVRCTFVDAGGQQWTVWPNGGLRQQRADRPRPASVLVAELIAHWLRLDRVRSRVWVWRFRLDMRIRNLHRTQVVRTGSIPASAAATRDGQDRGPTTSERVPERPREDARD
ncbi:hypothetical protein Ais01nite_21870 [Asanoa ishikariensis]|uniref:hypothetical protein n=1 Tax=Asanoa ishikariensis TaxID=137265 RepID=UPI00115F7F8E|nr:hypothetical protein [Asanoa ishikariensis]GIF64152.1 hypothetical protein Ais01nite_21870 [Asanoa ishikariensis]